MGFCMKLFFGFITGIILLFGGAYLSRDFIVARLYPNVMVAEEFIGVEPHDVAVKQYSISSPSELLVRVIHDDGTPALVTVSQADSAYSWTEGETGPLPVQFNISEGRYSTEWFSARTDETFRLAIANIAESPLAEEGTLARVVVYRRNPIPDWLAKLTPKAYEIEGARVQRFDANVSIDTNSVMNFVYELDD